jgi:hypothetical protein
MHLRMIFLELFDIPDDCCHLLLIFLCLRREMGRNQYQLAQLTPDGVFIPVRSLEIELCLQTHIMKRVLFDQDSRLHSFLPYKRVPAALLYSLSEVLVGLLQKDDVQLPLRQGLYSLTDFSLLIHK